MAPVLIEDKAAGELMVYPGSTPDRFAVQGPGMLELLKDWLPEAAVNQLSTAMDEGADGTRQLRSAALQAIGLTTSFDPAALELRIKVPPNIRRTNVILLNGRGVPPDNTEALSPSPLSGYVNVQSGEQFNFNHADLNNGRQPINTALTGVLNYRGWVIEANGTDTTSTPVNPFVRGDVRLLTDDPAHMIRYEGGDLSYPLATYQVFRAMAGVTGATNFTLQPYRVTVPVSSHEIFLTSPSKVVVYINGTQTQVLYLPAGRHDLRNMALGNGVNFVRLEITDNMGRVENVDFPWITEADLLTPGLHQFAYSVGAPSTQVGAHRDYNTGLLTASFLHRYGVSDSLTLGANLQADHTQEIGGVEILFNTIVGTFDLEPVTTHQQGGVITGGGRVRYLYTDYSGQSDTQRNATLGVEYKAPHFAQLGDVNPNVATAYDVQVSYSQLILNRIAARLALEYDLNRPGPTVSKINSANESLSLVKSWTAGLQTTVTLSHALSAAGLTSNDAYFLLSWTIPQTSHYLAVSEDTQRQASRVEWHYNTPQLVGGYNAGASFERDPGSNAADANLQYVGNRGLIGATHDLTTSWAGMRSQTTTLSVSTALAFADGRFAVGRPISDSFAIVAASDRLKGQTIDVNPNSNEYYEARSDWLGPGVLPTINSYRYYNLNLDPTRLDPGLELGQENYTFMPSFQSGVLIEAGTDSTIMAAGVLVGPDGKPLKLVSGEARPLGPEGGKPVFMFTNRKGKFRLEGFKPGQYELVLYDESWAPIRIVIPDGAVGIYDVGVLKARRLR